MPFTSVEGQQYYLQIYDAEATEADVVTLTAGSTPFTTDEATDEDLYVPVRTQSGYVRILIGEGDSSLLADLMPETATSRPVLLRRSSATGTVLWMGFLTGEQYSQPWAPAPYEVELPVTSVMGAMQGVPFTQDDGYTSARTLISTIATYLPVGIGYSFPANRPMESVCVPNYNFQEYQSPQERADNGTTNIYDTDTVYDVMQDFCKYFGVSLREHGSILIFHAPDTDTYGTGGTFATADLASMQVRSAANTTGFTRAYRKVMGDFATGKSKIGDSIIGMPSDFYSEFGINKEFTRYVLYNDNDYTQAYVNGSRGVATGTETFYLAGSSYGQILSFPTVTYNDYGTEYTDHTAGNRTWGTEPKAGYSTNWENCYGFRISQGIDACTMMLLKSARPVYIPPTAGTLFNISFNVENDMPTTEKLDSGLDPYIRCVYAKIRLGKYWLASEIKTQQSANPALTFYGSYSWSETEQECCLALINNKLQFFNDGTDVSTRTGESSDFAEMEGINVVLPTDLLGTCADLSIELLAKVYDDSQFFFKRVTNDNRSFGNRTGTDTSNTYDYIQFLIKDFAARLLIPATTVAAIATDRDYNHYVVATNSPQANDYSVSAAITTRNGSQYGTGCALDASHAYVTTRYDLLGLQRRATMLKRPREVLAVTVGERLEPQAKVSYDGMDYAIVSQSVDWKQGNNTVHLIDIS